MLSCAASENFSRVDNGGSCVLAFTAPKFGTTPNIRFVCLPSESSPLSWGATGVTLSDGCGEGLFGVVGACWRGSGWSLLWGWDHAIAGTKRMERTKTNCAIRDNALLGFTRKGGSNTHNACQSTWKLRILVNTIGCLYLQSGCARCVRKGNHSVTRAILHTMIIMNVSL